MYRLPTDLRDEFQRPFGPVLQTPDLPRHVRPQDTVLCVGDLVSRTALGVGLRPKLIVVDFATERRPVASGLAAHLRTYGERVVTVRNPAATITDELYRALLEALRAPVSTRIEVEGEEDLAGLPLFAEAPEGTVILYGMPGQGVVVVRNDAEMKAKARRLLERMRVPA